MQKIYNMNNDLDNLFKLTPDYIEKICKVAGSAFQDDPATIFSYPDEKERKEKIQYGFYSLYKYGMKNGLAYATSKNLEGITLWLPPKKIYRSTWTMMRYGMFYTIRKLGLKMEVLKRTLALFNYMEEKHKELVPYGHWYFQQIAVKPEEQGKGYGGLLISTMINYIESEGLPIYVDTNTEKAMSIYQKFGFEILEHTIIPKTDVPLWCMLRKPQ